MAESNTGPIDTVGNRHHAVLIGRQNKYQWPTPSLTEGASSLADARTELVEKKP